MTRISSHAVAVDTPPLIDHPATQPLDYQVRARSRVRAGGGGALYLRFRATHPPRAGSQLLLSIEAAGEVHRFHSRVVEVDRSTSPCRVVVCIGRKREAFAARMVEQICHIAHYRQSALTREGRALSEERAASEWIARFATGFPAL